MVRVTTLQEHPELFPQVITLLESSFGYQSPYHIEVDFYPLLNYENFKNCLLVINDKNEVIAHAAIKKRNIVVGNNIVPIGLLGGIAVSETHRGKGIFQNIFQEILKLNESKVAFFILWSDKNVLYEKFGFIETGENFEYRAKGNENKFQVSKHRLDQLPADILSQMKNLFQSDIEKNIACIQRIESDWKELLNISSTTLHIQHKDKIVAGYYLSGKGMDLKNIVHEFVNPLCILPDKDIKIWSPTPLNEKNFTFIQKTFLGLIRIANRELFDYFIKSMFKKEIKTSFNKQASIIHYNETKLSSDKEILDLLFSCGIAEKWNIFFSGLDSV